MCFSIAPFRTSRRSDACPTKDACRRQPQGRRRALSRGAVELEAAAMKLGHRSRERQSQAGPLVFSCQSAVDLTEGTQRLVEIACGNADAGVLDHDPQTLCAVLDADGDPATGGRELDRIRQQVEHDLLETPAVALH